MTNPSIQRALLLIEQKNFQRAETELKGAIAEDINNEEALVLLGLCKYQNNQPKEALPVINQAISLNPVNDFALYILAGVYLALDKKDSALMKVEEAIRINPYQADYFGLRGKIHLMRKEFKEARKFAEEGLQLEAENLSCLNVRSTALAKTGDKEEAFRTIETALEQDPDNAHTHSNHGFILLEKREYNKALLHFREALKLNPNSTYAKAGLIEALKAQSPVYSLFLQYSFWIGNLKGKKQWVMIIGFYFLFNFLKRIAINNEALQPFLIPLLTIMFVFAFSSWFISPLHNLFLFLNPYGKFALSTQEKVVARIVGALLSLAVIITGLYVFFPHDSLLGLAGLFFIMLMPVGSMFDASTIRNNRILVGYTIVAALIGLVGAWESMQSGILFNQFTVIFLVSIFVYQWVANALIIREA